MSIIVAGALAALAGTAIAVALRPIRAARRAEQLARIQRDFHRQREQLEAKFIDRAAATGKPRGLIWTNVAFDDDVIYVRDRRNQSLKALVAIEVSFEAVEGGGMEDVEAVSHGGPCLLQSRAVGGREVSQRRPGTRGRRARRGTNLTVGRQFGQAAATVPVVP